MDVDQKIVMREADLRKEAGALADLLRVTFKSDLFTPEFILWKHAENPMGESFALVVEDEGKLVGLRCFMFWDVVVDGKKLKAIRPVDTAVHPDMQGKGLFKKMTLQGLEMVKGKYDIVFNTPNGNSLPGYLKMGWQKISQQLPVFISIRPLLAGKISFDKTRDLPATVSGAEADIIRWRYRPENYQWAVFEDGTVIIYRTEKKKGSTLVILVDSFFVKQPLKKYVNSICARENAFVFMFLKNGDTASLSTTFAKKTRELVVVSRPEENKPAGNFKFSLGDLEGII